MANNQKNQKSPKQKLLETSLRFLSHRPRSRSELQKYLETKTTQAPLVTEVIAELDHLGFINDQQFTTWLIGSRLRHNPKGDLFLKHELARFGISSQLITSSLSAIDNSVWIQLAVKLLHKKRSTLAKYSGYQQKAKAYNFLQSKGFSSSIITQAIDEYARQQ